MRNHLFLPLALLLGCTPEGTNTTSPQEGPADDLEPPCRPELYGVNIDPLNPAGYPGPSAFQDAGAKWVRFVFKVDGGDLEGAFSRYDAVLDELGKAGIASLVVVNYETVAGKPARDASDGEWDDYLNRFADAAAAIAGRYGSSIAAIELWNEPDEPNPRPEYDPGMPPERFGQLLQRSYDAIHGAGSGALVITGGADSGDPNYLVQAGAATGGLYADGVGLHPYGQRAPDDYPSPDWGFGNYTDMVRRYHDATGLPVWITEIGTDDEPFQSDYVFQIYATTRAFFGPDVVPTVLWFAWSDGMVPPFGLLNADGSPKDTYTKYVEETRWGNAGCG